MSRLEPRCQPGALLLTAPEIGLVQFRPPVRHERLEGHIQQMNSTHFSILAAAGASAEAPPAWLQFMPLVAMGLIFWFLILRPQMRQQKQHREKIAAVKKGDQVLTGGGILGKVTRVDEHYADVEIAQGTKVKILKSTISDIVDKTAAAPAND